MPIAILFDLDDTLLDRRRSIEAYARRFHDDFARELASASPDELTALMLQADRGGYRARREVSDELMATLPWSNQPTVEVLFEHWMQHFPLDAQPRQHARKTLQTLNDQGFALGLITNGSTKGQNRKIDVTELRPFFSTIMISETAGIRKPARAIFDLALDELAMPPSEAWFVGDHPVNDIVGAAAAGLTPVWLRGMHDWPEEHPAPARQIDGLDEVPPLLAAEETGS